jgi:hypothetical protein
MKWFAFVCAALFICSSPVGAPPGGGAVGGVTSIIDRLNSSERW